MLHAVRVLYEAMKVLCARCSTGQCPWPHAPTYKLSLECYGLHVPCEPCWLHADNQQDINCMYNLSQSPGGGNLFVHLLVHILGIQRPLCVFHHPAAGSVLN